MPASTEGVWRSGGAIGTGLLLKACVSTQGFVVGTGVKEGGKEGDTLHDLLERRGGVLERGVGFAFEDDFVSSDFVGPDHRPNTGFGDAGRGLCESDEATSEAKAILSDPFSFPLAPMNFPSSASCADTGILAKGELRVGRVLGLPIPIPIVGVGGDGATGIGAMMGGVVNCNIEASFAGDPGGVVLASLETFETRQGLVCSEGDDGTAGDV
jgi:hypothetical protein